MRESQMKKIIAIAVASAFAAPVMAAEVSVSGDIDFVFQSADGVNTFDTAQSDLIVTGSETLANGMSVSGYVSIEGTDEATGMGDAHDSMITLSGDFGTITVGDDSDAGYNAFDNKTDVASTGGDFEIDSGNTAAGAVQFTPNLGIDGLSVAIGYAAGDAAGEEETGFGVQYSTGGLTIAYGKADVDGTDVNTSHLSASYTAGPLYVALDSYENHAGVEADAELALAATYKTGAITLFVERAKIEDAANMDVDDTIYGLEYDMGAVDVFVAQITDQTATGPAAYTEADSTRVGIEYKF